MQEGILVFKWSYNLVPWFVSYTLQEKGLCTILPLEEQKTAPTKAWTQYMGKITFQVGGDYITILPLSVLKAPRPYILKKSMISNHF